MKYFFTTLLFFVSFISKAQWSNTTNEFYDSLAMPVCTATGDQIFPLIERSYPDSGYFVIWEDNRDGINYNHTQIFVQKYDKTGNKLWANDGVPIATSTFSLHYNSFTANRSPGADFRQSNVSDLRNFSFTATDSSNGFYITYLKDSTYNYGTSHLYVVMVQHIHQDGTPVFPGEGYRLYKGAGPGSPQLVADGNKGFFVGYTVGLSPYVFCYKDENGELKLFGGGRMDENAIQDSTSVNGCLQYVVVSDPSVHCDGNFLLYSDKQGGCEVVMTMHKDLQTGVFSDYQFMAFNELFRVKKTSNVVTGDPVNPVNNYNKDNVIVLYQVRSRMVTHACAGPGGSGIITDVILTSNGFQRISDNHNYMQFAKGTHIPTDGNINVNVFGAIEKDNGQQYVVKVYCRVKEKYDSIPYAFTVGNFYASTLQESLPPGQNKINWKSDTIFYNGNARDFYNFSLVSSKDKIYASSFITTSDNQNEIFLQQLKLVRITTDSFAVVSNTNNKGGIKVAGENVTANNLTQILFNPPYISVDDQGHALLYILEMTTGYFIRVSPILDGCKLAWGSVGKQIRNIYTYLLVPVVRMSPSDGTALIAWTGHDNSSSQNNDIFIRHIDNLGLANYLAPIGKVKLLINTTGFGGLKSLYPNYISGLSGQWNVLNYGDNIPVVGLGDDNNLGTIAASVYQNWNVGIRKYKGQPYLDRNFTIVPQNSPTMPERVRLYFTNEEMDALKAADPSITGPEMLQVVKQPSLTPDAPGSFTSSASDEVVNPTSWGAVDGGYYLEVNVKSFSNFFIQKVNGPLPVTWINVNAKWKDNSNAIVSWQIGVQNNVKEYNLQNSFDGVQFSNVCEVIPDDSHSYNCTVPADQHKAHYYRVEQTDADGHASFSKVVVLNAGGGKEVTLYPNPVHNILHLGGLDKFDEIIIYGLQGNVLKRQKITNVSMEIDVSKLASGNYFIELLNDQGSTRYRFLKE